MSSPRDPHTPFELIAKLGHALSSPVRVRLLHLLCQCERTVEGLADVLGLSVATVSHHLQQMRRIRLVTARKTGRYVTYGLTGEVVRDFWLNYRDFATDRSAELQLLSSTLISERRSRGLVDRQALRRLVKQKAAVLLDVRPAAEFDAGHLPGAISMPIDQLKRQLRRIPAGKTVVLYCRGPYCLLADEAQRRLMLRGISALRLDDGVVEWAAAGLPVSKSPGYRPVLESPSK